MKTKDLTRAAVDIYKFVYLLLWYFLKNLNNSNGWRKLTRKKKLNKNKKKNKSKGNIKRRKQKDVVPFTTVT